MSEQDILTDYPELELRRYPSLCCICRPIDTTPLDPGKSACNSGGSSRQVLVKQQFHAATRITCSSRYRSNRPATRCMDASGGAWIGGCCQLYGSTSTIRTWPIAAVATDCYRPILLKNSLREVLSVTLRNLTSQIDPGSTIAMRSRVRGPPQKAS
jgi:hypothetical protein